MRFYATVDVLKFDARTYSKAFHDAIDRQMKAAARAFVRAAVLRIPVDTGMAAGSFLNLGRYLKRIGIPGGVGGYIDANRKSPTGRYYHRPGKAKKPIPKNEFTPGNYGLVTDPVAAFQRKGQQHLFEFKSEVFHLTLNDLFGSHGRAPWGAFEAAQLAFLATLKTLVTKVPGVKEHMTKTTVTLGQSGLKAAAPVRLRKQQKVRND